MQIYLVTQNPGKVKAANSVFKKYDIEIKGVEKDYPEIQADSSLEIAKHTALEAARDLKSPAIREDHSLYLNALGIPGPYMSFVEKKLSVHKLLEILSTQKDRTGYFELAAVYAKANRDVKEFVYKVPIHIKTKIDREDPRGGWNGVICLEGEMRAFTEYPEEERLSVWSKNFEEIARFLDSRKA